MAENKYRQITVPSNEGVGGGSHEENEEEEESSSGIRSDVDDRGSNRDRDEDVRSIASGSVASGQSGMTGASGASGTSIGNKEKMVTKLLDLIPVKDRDELLYGDVDVDDEDAKPTGDIVEELEACASENERAKTFYIELMDNPFVGVVVVNAQTQQIVWVNQYTSFLFNLVEQDIVGQDVSLLLGAVPGRDNKSFHRKKISSYMHTWKTKQAQPESKIVSGRAQEVLASRFEGIKKVNFTAQIVIRPVRMSQLNPQSPPFAFVGYFRDASAEKTLKLSLASYRYITNKASEAIIIADTVGVIKEMNHAAAKLFGYDGDFLIATEANLSLLMPPAISSVHDRYLKSFREKLETPGFDIRSSPIIAKARDLPARRSDGVEFPVQLRAEIHVDTTHAGNDRLVGYIRDCRALIKASEFKLEVSKRLFPESIAKIVGQKEENEIRLVETYKNVPVILLDMVGFTGRTQNMDHDSVFELVNSMYKKAAEVAVGYQVEVVKATGDGVIAVCGIDEFDDPKSRMDRAVCFALSLLRWTQQNQTPIRVGIGYGELGSAVFEISKGRPTWDIWANAVCEASRMEHNANPQSLQIMLSAFKVIKEPELKAVFQIREHSNGIKGLADGGKVFTYETKSKNFDSTSEICEKVLNAALSRVYLKRENARELKEQQDRRKLTGT